MKSTANAARSPFLIMTLLLSMLFASLALAADEGAPIKDVIVKEGKDMNNIQVHAVKNQDGWALASFTYEDDKHVTQGGFRPIEEIRRSLAACTIFGKNTDNGPFETKRRSIQFLGRPDRRGLGFENEAGPRFSSFQVSPSVF